MGPPVLFPVWIRYKYVHLRASKLLCNISVDAIATLFVLQKHFGMSVFKAHDNVSHFCMEISITNVQMYGQYFTFCFVCTICVDGCNEESYILNKIINAPCGTLKLLLALGVAKYIKSYKIHFVVQYATDYCPLEHDNYKTISAHLGSPISCYINNLHGAFIFLLSVQRTCTSYSYEPTEAHP